MTARVHGYSGQGGGACQEPPRVLVRVRVRRIRCPGPQPARQTFRGQVPDVLNATSGAPRG